MAEIAVSAFTLKDVNMIIGTDEATLGTNDYKQHVSRVRFDPTTSSSTWKPLSPNYSLTSQGLATWTCSLAVAQDWGATSLASYLLANEGKKVKCSFQPTAGAGAVFTAILVLAAPAIGGDVDTTALSEVVCGVVGKPVKTP